MGCKRKLWQESLHPRSFCTEHTWGAGFGLSRGKTLSDSWLASLRVRQCSQVALKIFNGFEALPFLALGFELPVINPPLREYDYRFQSLSNLVQFRTARLSHTHCSYGVGAT